MFSLFFRDRKNQRSRRFDAAAADQGSTGPLDPPHDFVAWPSLCAQSAPAHRRRAGARSSSPLPSRWRPYSKVPPTLWETPHPAAPLTLIFLFIGLSGLPAPVALRETPHPAAPPTLPKLASGLSGSPHAAGHPAPSPAAHAAFSFLARFSVTGFLCKTFGAGEGKMRGKRGGKF